jgi:hypothetical protein
MLWEPFKVTEPSFAAVGYLDQIANSTLLSAAFYLLPTAVGNGAMNKFGNCGHWRSELLKPRMLLFSIGYESSAILAMAQWMLRAVWILINNAFRSVAASTVTHRRDEIMLTLAIWSRIAKSCTRWRGILKVLSQDWGRADFSKNLSQCCEHFLLVKLENF